MSQRRITSDNEQIGASTSLPLRSIPSKSCNMGSIDGTYNALCYCFEGRTRTGGAVSRTVISRRKDRRMGDLPLAWDANSSEASNEDGWARSDNDETDVTDHAATFPAVAKRRGSRSGSGEIIPLAKRNVANLRIAGSELTLEHNQTRKHPIYVIQVRRTPSQCCFQAQPMKRLRSGTAERGGSSTDRSQDSVIMVCLFSYHLLTLLKHPNIH